MPPPKGNSSTEPEPDGSFVALFQEIDDYVDHGEEEAASSSERTLVEEARQGIRTNQGGNPQPAQVRRGGQEEANLLPSEIHPQHGWMKWLDTYDADYRDGLCVGEGYGTSRHRVYHEFDGGRRISGVRRRH